MADPPPAGVSFHVRFRQGGAVIELSHGQMVCLRSCSHVFGDMLESCAGESVPLSGDRVTRRGFAMLLGCMDAADPGAGAAAGDGLCLWCDPEATLEVAEVLEYLDVVGAARAECKRRTGTAAVALPELLAGRRAERVLLRWLELAALPKLGGDGKADAGLMYSIGPGCVEALVDSVWRVRRGKRRRGAHGGAGDGGGDGAGAGLAVLGEGAEPSSAARALAVVRAAAAASAAQAAAGADAVELPCNGAWKLAYALAPSPAFAMAPEPACAQVVELVRSSAAGAARREQAELELSLAAVAAQQDEGAAEAAAQALAGAGLLQLGRPLERTAGAVRSLHALLRLGWTRALALAWPSAAAFEVMDVDVAFAAGQCETRTLDWLVRRMAACLPNDPLSVIVRHRRIRAGMRSAESAHNNPNEVWLVQFALSDGLESLDRVQRLVCAFASPACLNELLRRRDPAFAALLDSNSAYEGGTPFAVVLVRRYHCEAMLPELLRRPKVAEWLQAERHKKSDVWWELIGKAHEAKDEALLRTLLDA